MNRKIVFAAVAAIAVGSIWYLNRTAGAPPVEQAQGAIGMKPMHLQGDICVMPVSNYSNRPVSIEDADQVLIGELRKAGILAVSAAKANGKCDGVVHTEIVEISGRNGITAKLDFRLVGKASQVPVLSASVKGKFDAPEGAAPVNSFSGSNSFASSSNAKDQSLPVKAALTAAFAEQAKKLATSSLDAK